MSDTITPPPPAPQFPQNRRIVIQNPDGSVAIVVPAPGATVAQVMQAVPAGAVFREVGASEPPTDRTFRNAWGHDLSVDMPRAQAIQRDRIRARRVPLLAALDVESVRATERGDAAALARIAAEKQSLRDAPTDPRIELATTPAELARIGMGGA